MRILAKSMLLAVTLCAVSAHAQEDKKTARNWKAKCASCHGAEGKADTEQGQQTAQQTLDALPGVTALQALTANAQLVELLVGRRWYVIQAAGEAGASWDDVGVALGMSGQAAEDWYRDKIAHREQYVPDLHDATRARQALTDQAHGS